MKKSRLILLNHLMLIVLLFFCDSMRAQRSDTLRCGLDRSFGWSQTIAPVSLLAAGSVISFTPLHDSWDIAVQDWAQHDGHERREVEDVIQYVPCASVLLLKACGLESKHGWLDMAGLSVGSYLLGCSMTHSLKYYIDKERPYNGVYYSFPSGHTFTAFVGAELIRREYGEEYPGIAVAGYAVAAGVGAMRIYNNRHWCSDVLAGAGIGILSASVMYWLAPYLRF